MWKTIKKRGAVKKNTVHSFQTLYRQGFWHYPLKPSARRPYSYVSN